MPCASFASMSAVAGAITSKSMRCATAMCSIALSTLAAPCFAAEKLGDHFLSGQRRKRQRSDEFLRAARHHHLHVELLLLQPAHQFGGLVGRHSSAKLPVQLASILRGAET